MGAGFFYTNANGGSPIAEGTIRAGFDVSKHRYFVNSLLTNFHRTSII